MGLVRLKTEFGTETENAKFCTCTKTSSHLTDANDDRVLVKPEAPVTSAPKPKKKGCTWGTNRKVVALEKIARIDL